jgi:hypothetical protein
MSFRAKRITKAVRVIARNPLFADIIHPARKTAYSSER